MSDMKLQMIVTGNNSGLNQVLQQSDRSIRGFTQGAAGHFGRMQSQVGRMWQSINGMSAAAKMVGFGGGMMLAKSVIDDNLAFERTLLRMKFNAQMTTRELAELRKMAMDLSKVTMNSPLDVAQMQLRLAMAGLKMPMIRQLSPSIAGAAQVFEAPAGEIANLVFDKIAKTGIKPERVPQMLDMLYYHGTSGRFETADMARQAPELLNAGSTVGLTGENGLNLMGALTQRMMRNATVSIPSEVSTLVKHGLGHITQSNYVKKLGKYGIDVPSYFDDRGRFKGEGGVEGILALTRKMIDKGLENPFKLSQAGMRDQYTKTFWLEMMRSVKASDSDTDPNLLKMMERGRAAMESGQLATNLGVIKEANFGKIKAAEIEIQKAKLSSGAQAATGALGSAAAQFSENPITTTLAGVGALWAGKTLLGKLTGGKDGGLGQLGAGAGGATPVFVTNWPGGPVKASERLRRLAEGSGSGAGAGAGAAAAAAGGGALASAAAGVGLIATPGVIAYAAKKYFESDAGQKGRASGMTLEIERLQARLAAQKGPGYQDKDQIDRLQKQVDHMKADRDAILSRLEAVATRPVEVHIDGHKVAETVNKVNGRDARRQ
jgi:hypothetical protein